MAIKAEDRPKLIGLLVGIVGVIVYVLIVLVPKLSATAAPAPHTDAPTTLTAASATAPAQTAAAGADSSAALPDSDEAPIPAPPHRDSFTPPPMDGKGQLPNAQGPAAKPAGPQGMPPGPGLATGVMQPIAIQAPAPPPATPSAPALPPLELKGVILGDPSVAVLSVNGEVVQRQVGDTIVGELKLVKISDAGISIQYGKKQIAVTVGHAMPGTSPMLQPATPAAAGPAKP